MHTFKWLIFCLTSLQLSFCDPRLLETKVIDKFYRLPKFADPSLTNQPSIYLIDSSRVYKLVNQGYPFNRQSAYHQSEEGQFDKKSPEPITVIQSKLMDKSDDQSNEENYLEHDKINNQMNNQMDNRIDKLDASSYRQSYDHKDHQSIDYYHYSNDNHQKNQPHSHHRPYSSYQHYTKPHKPIYVAHPDKVNPLLILAQDTIRLQEEMLFAIMPHPLRNYLIRIIDGQMGKLKGSKNTQYDPDKAWFGKGILVKAKKPYAKY